jgi:hypothetical protein
MPKEGSMEKSYRPKLFCSGPVPRRHFLQFGGASLGGLGLANILRLRAEAGVTNPDRSDTAVILVWLGGGPPHTDTYDMKPDAPSEYRGELKPIHTNVPGIDVCELLPFHAKIADKFTLVRSITHDFADHGGGTKRVLTGRIPKSPVGFINDAPAVGCVVAKMREQRVKQGMPHWITLSDFGEPNGNALGPAYLGPAYLPFDIPGDPKLPNFKIPNLEVKPEFGPRITDRQALLSRIDRLRRDLDRTGAMEAMDKYNHKAIELLTSAETRKAFDWSLEDSQTLARYGHQSFGLRALLARRLVEAGSSFVWLSMSNPDWKANLSTGVGQSWDSHSVNCHHFTDFRWRAPFYDQAVTALIEDIYARGLDKKVMIVAMGEFGRTPQLEYSVGTNTGVMQPGRGHWPGAMSVLVSGGGMPMGQVVGSTNAKGEMPKDRPLSPNDLWATIYRHLGIDYNHAFLDHSGRPMPILPFGEPIGELI